MYDTNFEREMEQEGMKNEAEDKVQVSLKVKILTAITYTIATIVSLAVLALIIEVPIWLFKEILK